MYVHIEFTYGLGGLHVYILLVSAMFIFCLSPPSEATDLADAAGAVDRTFHRLLTGRGRPRSAEEARRWEVQTASTLQVPTSNNLRLLVPDRTVRGSLRINRRPVMEFLGRNCSECPSA